MASRKTIEVIPMVAYVNELLAMVDGDRSRRQGLIIMAEKLLHDSGNYKGFRYLNQHEIPKAAAYPGIWVDENMQYLPYPNRFENTDDTCIQFYL
jgi:hypothetical protein